MDYRRLNALTHKDAYPLPHIKESLNGLKAVRWYSTLDLASSYWQVEMNPPTERRRLSLHHSTCIMLRPNFKG